MVIYACHSNLPSSNISSSHWNYRKGDYVALNSSLVQINWNNLFENNDVETNWNIFKDKLNGLLPLFVPKTSNTHKPKKPLWWSKHLCKAIRQKQYFYRLYKKNNSMLDYQKYASQRNFVKSMTRRAQRNCEEVIIKNIRKNPRMFHSYIKSRQKVKQLIMQLEKDNDSVTNGPCDVAETFAKHFNSVFIEEKTDDIPNFCSRTQHEIVIVDVSEGVVFGKLNSLNCYKCPGPDGLHPWVLKHCSDTLSKPLFSVTYHRVYYLLIGNKLM